MKGHKNNIFIRFYDYMTKKYKAPEECKLLMAERNLNTMVKAQVMLILLGIYGLISILITNKGNYMSAIPRFFILGNILFLAFYVFLLLQS